MKFCSFFARLFCDPRPFFIKRIFARSEARAKSVGRAGQRALSVLLMLPKASPSGELVNLSLTEGGGCGGEEAPPHFL